MRVSLAAVAQDGDGLRQSAAVHAIQPRHDAEHIGDVEVAEMRDRSPERRDAELEKDPKHLAG